MTELTPPRNAEERIDWLRLIRSRRVGPQTFARLVAEHGSAAAALDALPGVAAAAGVAGYHPCPRAAAEREFDAGARAGARLLCRGSADYPPALADLPDAPPVLWALGDTRLTRRAGIALVGARNASSLGTRMARRLATGLGEAGYTVISGLARGIDTAAHLAALGSGTIAVMPGGIETIYPLENTGLAADIARDGLRLSEQPVGLTPQARHFPQRNRLISGLARAVVVVEGAARSGSLITARTALDQGREVMAVPGHPLDARAAGCNTLIRDGATLIRSAGDVVEALAGPLPAPRADQPGLPLGAAEPPAAGPPLAPAVVAARILDLLGPSPVAEDQLIRDLDLPAQDVAQQILALELDGRVARRAGGMLCRPA